MAGGKTELRFGMQRHVNQESIQSKVNVMVVYRRRGDSP